jgi:hypothetical protein
MFKNRIMTRMSGTKGDEVRDEENYIMGSSIHCIHSSSNIITVIKEYEMNGHVTRMRKM